MCVETILRIKEQANGGPALYILILVQHECYTIQSNQARYQVTSIVLAQIRPELSQTQLLIGKAGEYTVVDKLAGILLTHETMKSLQNSLQNFKNCIIVITHNIYIHTLNNIALCIMVL